ncbi:MAG: DsrE family protein [Betaproteobacteria bacterium]|nr:DsrE family protein [Betaproteobacteria bacterium]
MKRLLSILAPLAVALVTLVPAAHAGDKDPLFVNLTTDDPHRASMALAFGGNQHGRGHPLTVFLNDRGVHLAARSQAGKFGAHQKSLAELMAKGATVLVCGMCMKHYGVAEKDLVAGARPANPELTGAALFADGAKSLTW